MKKSFLIILIAFTTIFAVDIDIHLLNELILKDKNDNQNRLILAKYYLSKKELLKAEKLTKEVLKIDPKNKTAKKLYKKIKRAKIVKELLNEYGVTDINNQKEIERLFDKLYDQKQYKKFITFYKLLNSQEIPLSQKVHKKAAFLYLKNKQFKKTDKIIQEIENPILKKELKADKCFYEKNYKCSKKLYTEILKTSYSKHSLKYLLETLYELKDYEKFEKLYKIVKEKYPNDFDLIYLNKKREQLKIALLKTLKQSYEKNPSFENLKAYATSLYSFKREKEAIKIVREFTKKHTNHQEALLLLSSMLIWQQNYKESSKILEKLVKTGNQKALTPFAIALYLKGDYEKAIPYLKKAIENEKDKKIIRDLQKKLLFALYWSKREKEAKTFLNKIKKFYTDDKEIKELEIILNGNILKKIKFYEKKEKENPNDTHTILKLAQLYKKAAKERESLKYFEKYYDMTKNIQVGKYLAQTYYLKGDYEKASFYFKEYLKQKNSDKLTKYQYAITLQNLKKYKEAAKIYKELLTIKDENYFDIKYRYGFCLLKTKNEKDWLEAREVFKTLLNELKYAIQKDPNNKDLQTLLKFTQNSYKISQKEFLKPKVYKDIVLAEGLKKNLKEYPTLLTTLNALKAKPKKEYEIKKLLPKTEEKEPKKKEISIKGKYFKDSSNIKVKKVKVSAKNITKIENIDTTIGLYGERFQIEGKKRYNGSRGGIILNKNNFTLYLGETFYDYFNEPYASIEYETKIYNHLLNIFFEYQNGSLYENHPYLLKNKISAIHLQISDFIKLLEGKELSAEISLTRFKDGNIRITPAFSLLFLSNKIQNITNNFYLTGWYQFYTKEISPYVYNKKDDATRAEIQSNIEISPKFSITPKINAGYSLNSKSFIYGGGFIIEYEINKFLYLVIDCTSNKIKGKKRVSDYNYEECRSNIKYRW